MPETEQSLPITNKQKANNNGTWNARQALLVSVLAYFVAQLFVAIPIVILTLNNGEAAVDNELLSQPWVSLMLTGISALGLIATLLLFFRYKKISIRKLGFKKINAKTVGYVPVVYFVYAVALVIALSLVTVLFPGFNPEQVQDVGFKDAAGWQLLLAFLGLVVIAPIAEEMLFRGFLYKGLKNHGSSKLIIIFGLLLAVFVAATAGSLAGFTIAAVSMLTALIITKNHKYGAALFTSMLFGLVHMQWNVAVDTFILSFALIWIFEKTGNLWAPVLLHALKNFIAFVFVFGLLTIPGV